MSDVEQSQGQATVVSLADRAAASVETEAQTIVRFSNRIQALETELSALRQELGVILRELGSKVDVAS